MDESQEPVISAYLAGLLRDAQNTSPATNRSGHHTPQAAVAPGGSGSGARSTRPPPSPCRLLRQLRPAVAPTTPRSSCRHPLPPGAPSPPGGLAAADTARSADACCVAGAIVTRGGSLRGARCALSGDGEQQGGQERCPHCCCVAALHRPCGRNHGRTTAAAHPAPPPATAPSGTQVVAAMTAEMGWDGRARTAPEHPTAPPPPRRLQGCGRDTGLSPLERWDWCEDEDIAKVGAGARDAPCRRQQQQRRRRMEPSGCDVSRQGEDFETFFLCRGWGKKWRKKSTPRQKEGDSVDTLAAQSPPPPEDVSMRLGRESGERFGPGRCCSQQESIPQNMFLTRTHRRGRWSLAPPA